MKSELRQVFFMAVFWFLCTAFVFFVPWWNSNKEEVSDSQEVIEDTLTWETLEVVDSYEWKILRLWVVQNNNQFNSALERVILSFKSNYWWDVEIVSISPSSFSWSNLNVDLLLLPYDLLTGFDLNPFVFEEDITPLFISQLRNFVKENNTFMPFGIDIPVMYGKSSLWNGLDWLILWAQNRNPTRSYAPFNFWISDNSSTLDNSLISAQQVIDFVEVNNVWGFDTWVDFTPANKDLQDRLLKSIQWSSELCNQYPLSCLLDKWLLWVAWWFKSNYNNHFEESLKMWTYPYQWKLPFVRLYGFVLPTDAKEYLMALYFVSNYMMEFSFWDWKNSMALDSKLSPVFQNEYEANCRQDACSLSQSFTILEDAYWKILKLLNDSAFWNVIEKKVQPNLYLEKTLL